MITKKEFVDIINRLKETDDFVYYWWQSNENANIADERVKEEFVEMQRYYKAIKNSFEVKTVKKEENGGVNTMSLH